MASLVAASEGHAASRHFALMQAQVIPGGRTVWPVHCARLPGPDGRAERLCRSIMAVTNCNRSCARAGHIVKRTLTTRTLVVYS